MTDTRSRAEIELDTDSETTQRQKLRYWTILKTLVHTIDPADVPLMDMRRAVRMLVGDFEDDGPLVLRGLTKPTSTPHLQEAKCSGCGETLIPHYPEDEGLHYEREDGTPCMEPYIITGHWVAPNVKKEQ